MFMEPYNDSNYKDYFDKFDCDTIEPLLSYDNILVKNLMLLKNI